MLKATFNLFFDAFFSILVVNNLDIFIWRIIWDTQDLYLHLIDIYYNSIISLFIAYVLIFIVKCIQINEIHVRFQHMYADRLAGASSTEITSSQTLRTKLRIKLLTLIISVANINHWRCLWYISTEYTQNSFGGILTIGAVTFLIMGCMSRVCCLVSSPFQIGKDSYNAAFGIQPASANHNYYLSLENELATNLPPNDWQIFLSFLFEFISDICTIHMWRSLWCYLDLHLYVGDKFKSAWVSLAAGLCLYFLVHLVNKPLNNYISNHSKEKNNNGVRLLKKLPIYMLFIFCFSGTIFVWRGIWELQNYYCYPLIFRTKVLNQNLLNCFYFMASLLVLWTLDLVASLQSRSMAEDSYFMVKGNYVLEPDLFENYFKASIRVCHNKSNESQSGTKYSEISESV